MRLLVVAMLIASGVAASGCLSEAPLSFHVPSLRVGDTATYVGEDGEGPLRIQVWPAAPIVSTDLAVVSAYRLDVERFAGDAPSRLLYYHTGDGEPVGYVRESGSKPYTYHATRDGQSSWAGFAYLAFHGFAGEELRVGERFEVTPGALGVWGNGRGCTLEVTDVYQVSGESRADLSCRGYQPSVRMTFSERSPFPLTLDHGPAFRLNAFNRSQPPGNPVEPVAMPPAATSGPYTHDGPPERHEFAYSLQDATRAVRESPPTRQAKQCLDERPDAVLTDAFLRVDDDGHEWSLTWTSDDGNCRARVDSRNRDNPAGVGDSVNQGTGPGVQSDLDARDAVDLSDAFAVWDQMSSEPPNYFALKWDSGLEFEYAFENGAMYLQMDAAAPRLNHITFK